MAEADFRSQIKSRWEQYHNKLSDIHNLLKQNQDISHLECENRKQSCNERQLANSSIRTELLLSKLKKLNVSEVKDSFSEKQLLNVVYESIQGKTNDIRSIEYLEKGLNAAKCVGKINAGLVSGTGFLIGENLLITNHHVLMDYESSSVSKFILDYEDNFVGNPKISQEFEIEPDSFFISNSGLDFIVVAVKPVSDAGVPLKNYGYHPLIVKQGKIKIGDPVNIIHHPNGDTKKVTFRNNQLIFIVDENGANANPENADNYCLYLADTLTGSSGAPVFNDRWEVIAIHHSGAPINVSNSNIDILEESKKGEAELKANEGIRISKIVKAIEDHDFDQDQNHMKEKRDSVLKLWQRDKPSTMENTIQVESNSHLNDMVSANGLKITIHVNPN
jgi:endonuclease G